MSEFAQQTVGIFVESGPYLMVGFLFAGIAKEWLGRAGALGAALRRPGARSVALAAVVGAPLPLCSCSVLPAAIGLRREGVSAGATASFLVSVPETDVVSVLLTWGLLGPVMAVVRPIVAVVTALVTGLAVDAAARGNVPSTESQGGESCGCGCPDECDSTGSPGESGPGTSERSPGWRRVLRYGFVEFLDDVSGPLVLGLLLAGAVSALAPLASLAHFGDSAVWGYVLALLVGIPTYVCATASTPLALGLIGAGMSPGAALVLLLVGPATNVASFVLLQREFGRRLVVIYAATIAATALFAGLALDAVVGSRAVRAAAGVGAERGPVPWEIAVAVVMALLLGASLHRTRALPRTFRRVVRSVGLAG